MQWIVTAKFKKGVKTLDLGPIDEEIKDLSFEVQGRDGKISPIRTLYNKEDKGWIALETEEEALIAEIFRALMIYNSVHKGSLELAHEAHNDLEEAIRYILSRVKSLGQASVFLHIENQGAMVTAVQE